jgi:phosphopantothenoylcysteine synthetase/decarboxylase
MNAIRKKEMEKKHILIGCTGSVASIKIPELILALRNIDVDDDVRPG